MQTLVEKIFLKEPSLALKSAYIEAAEWNQPLGVLYIGLLVIPLSNVREMRLKPTPPPAPVPVPTVDRTPAPAEKKRIKI